MTRQYKRPHPNGIKSPNYRDEYGTPHSITIALGPFDGDPFASQISKIGTKYNYTKADNGLLFPWDGYWWCNPAFSLKEEAIEMAHQYPNGQMLLPMNTDTKWWQQVAKKCGYAFFFGNRITYAGAKSPAIYESGIIPFGDYAIERLQNSGLKGVLMKIV